MNIMLGNLTVSQIEEKLGIELSQPEIDILQECRQDMAKNIAPDKWHCFDIPFTLVCGSMETAIKVADILRPYSELMQCQLQIAIDEKDE